MLNNRLLISHLIIEVTISLDCIYPINKAQEMYSAKISSLGLSYSNIKLENPITGGSEVLGLVVAPSDVG